MRVLERKPLPERFNEWITADEDRENNGDDPIYADVHDGALWRECEEWLKLTGRPKRATDDDDSVGEDEKSNPQPLHIALQLNGDAYQAYGKRSPAKAAAFYAAILNLPSDIRYQLEHVIVLGILPGTLVSTYV